MTENMLYCFTHVIESCSIIAWLYSKNNDKGSCNKTKLIKMHTGFRSNNNSHAPKRWNNTLVNSFEEWFSPLVKISKGDYNFFKALKRVSCIYLKPAYAPVLRNGNMYYILYRLIQTLV